jgi:hypothetical protein
MTLRAFVHFTARISPEANSQRERLEAVYGDRPAQLLERLFSCTEAAILKKLTKEEAAAYMARSLDRDTYLATRRRAAAEKRELRL